MSYCLGQFWVWGASLSLVWQFSIHFLRLFTSQKPGSALPFFSVGLGFVGNLLLVLLLGFLTESIEALLGFLIAYLFHIVLLVLASCLSVSEKK